MMNNHALQIWMTSFLFILGLLVTAVGLWMLISPQQFLKTGMLLSKWVGTEGYFTSLDKPHYQERVFYKHHRVVGGMIVLGAAYTLAVLLKVDMETIRPNLFNRNFSNVTDWLYSAAHFLIVGGNILAIVFGIVMFTRPSMLKNLEERMNKWIPTEEKLKKLDEIHNMPANILPGKPRLWGLIVILCGLYIVISTWGLVQ